MRVAQYLRMSTEHQQYSTENQADAIIRYAEHHGLEIVRTYADEGKSGLDVNWRPALKKLIADVTEGRADFEMVLVYDIINRGGGDGGGPAGAHRLPASPQNLSMIVH